MTSLTNAALLAIITATAHIEALSKALAVTEFFTELSLSPCSANQGNSEETLLRLHQHC